MNKSTHTLDAIRIDGDEGLKERTRLRAIFKGGTRHDALQSRVGIGEVRDMLRQGASDDEVKAHYDQHAKEFMTPDQVVIDYIELKKSAFFDQVKVTDEELKAQYEKDKAAAGIK